MLQARLSASTSIYSSSMILFIGLVHFLCLSQPVGSATIKSADSRSDHGITIFSQHGHVQGVRSASQRRSTTNSGCYKYLHEKDGCAYANPTNNCARKISSMAVQLFAMGAPSPASNTSSGTTTIGLSAPSDKALSKRSRNDTSWTSPNTTSFLATESSQVSSKNSSGSSGRIGDNSNLPSKPIEDSICGNYTGEEQMGVCLWSGISDSQSGNSSGWVSSDITANCHKEVILHRSGSNGPLLVARVLEGCSFNTAEPSVGCSQIYITKKVFMALNPNPSELEKGALEDPITWDFVCTSAGNERFPAGMNCSDELLRQVLRQELPEQVNIPDSVRGKTGRTHYPRLSAGQSGSDSVYCSGS
ncbi:hypothetical protein PCANC_09159 [Puccinia coronata f. sp. avenae]|uniref:Uncharacterized protein n=1 Tax=Puccinia coronata f. sp. avenae TaxID=200324 RepID=A0A2N5T4X4_9BASI|nr:hypothetical protein PCASD_18949 [Puccinia coronata f. sp. avenae]PLW20536.1 hypothetical protein PCANC_13585 [Puccinia coronata f. sp. avenae]PLW53853.1 hypothetical protein PCANC_09159 [Puccinia coronata f. sp. avenae]